MLGVPVCRLVLVFKRHAAILVDMKVFDLHCDALGHVFEGWFASHEDYDSQQARGLVSCPVCGSDKVSKRLSAPHLNVGHLRAPQAPAAASSASGEQDGTRVARLQAAMLQQIRAMVNKAENVGPRFAEEARRIHEGEAQERAIRGTSTPEERRELAEDGIDFMALPEILDNERLQ
jgi:hypothetical protein